MLTATAPLPRRPHRVAVAGVSGSGKSSLSRRIAEVLDLPYTEIDGLFHGADWTKRPEFEADVEAFTAAPGWVTEWQYDFARPLLVERADLLVWLDPPYPMVLQRVVRRTLRRRLRRQELWNGNQEPPLRTFFTDDEHIVRWSIRTRHLYDERIPVVAAQRPDLTIVRLGSTREVDPWLREIVQPLA
ncbi:adenylate kinase [Nocardioides endophyticus]|uniref:Adenylate kinase n=1 Tax=Nocardioides endophyticus TaxID=1353775 RepID=A0ABP8Z2W6_9ACTN